MVEPRCAEVVLHVSWKPFVLAEDDAEDDAAADAVRAAPDGALDAVAERVTEPRDPAAPPDLAPARRLEHDVDALARQPRALVESVLLGSRLRDADRRLDDGTARRRAADGEHEEHSLTHRLAPERTCHRQHASRVGRGASGCDGHELRNAGLAHARDEDAPAKRVHAERAPPEPDERERDADRRKTRRAVEHCASGDRGKR